VHEEDSSIAAYTPPHQRQSRCVATDIVHFSDYESILEGSIECLLTVYTVQCDVLSAERARWDQGLRSSRDGVRRQGGIRTIRPLQAQRPKRVAVTKQRAELHVDELDRLVVPLCQPKKRPFS
jgi:hypothetical protein